MVFAISSSIVFKSINMRKKYLFIAVICCIGLLNLHAQKEIPKGYSNGKIMLADSTLITGYIKENMRSNSSVSIITGETGKKKNYNGSELMSADIDSARFICIKGDFFKIVCYGDISFLQKESDASAKPVYNGTEALFINGTEGKINDYFFYDRKQQQLKLLTKKNRDEVINGSFMNCTAAISKARETGDDLSQLGLAVEIYNNRNVK